MEKKIELLAPAKNLEQGIAAIDHGADAIYIGAPQFGARVAAGNSMKDIEQLVRYAHLFGSKVFATVNTLLFDNELAEAEHLMWQLYNAGIDAVIVQDMGLLELHLPPVELHASTQTHNIDPKRIKFLEQVGFKRIILARETSIEQMAIIRQQTSADLEAFVQGALCVCYSGQCYLSQYLTGRSGNRGACSQPCRSNYNLVNEDNLLLKKTEHLLSLKDFSAAQHIESMISAGITSFKIEGRLKDIGYVKNVTSYYRLLLDNLIRTHNGLKPASSGSTSIHFAPDLSRTFNRGFTDYFLTQRKSMASLATQKSLGKKVGEVRSVKGNQMILKSNETFTAGDGLCFFNTQGQLEGFLVNHANGTHITANKSLAISVGTQLWRNNDFAFEKMLRGHSAERKITVSITLMETTTGLQLKLRDEDGLEAVAEMTCDIIPALDAAQASNQIIKQLSKLGNTPFQAGTVTFQLSQPPFLPASQLNELRRQCVERLQEQRIQFFHPKDTVLIPNNIAYPYRTLDYRANIINHNAETFYRRHQVQQLEHGLEETHDYAGKALMTTKYCLRFEIGQCLKCKNNKSVSPEYKSNLYLLNGINRFRLLFDCQRCEMHIYSDPKTI